MVILFERNCNPCAEFATESHGTSESSCEDPGSMSVVSDVVVNLDNDVEQSACRVIEDGTIK